MKIRSAVPAVILCFLLAGCGDSSTEPTAQSFSQQDAQEVVNALFSVFWGADFAMLDGPVLFRDGRPAGAGALATTDSITANCPRGGTATAVWTENDGVNPSTGSGTVTESGRYRFNACAVTISRGVVTANGDPDVTFQGSYQMQNWNYVGEEVQSLGGAFRTTGALTGRCAFNATWRYNNDTGQESFTGTICGHPAGIFD
jgi:hypothetical protein